MKMKHAHSHLACKPNKARRFLRFLNKPAGFRDYSSGLFDQRGLIRLATFTWTKAGFLSVLMRHMEAYILWPCPACSTWRTAVDTSSFYRIIESAVRLRITGDDRCPTGISFRCGCKLRVFHYLVHNASLLPITTISNSEFKIIDGFLLSNSPICWWSIILSAQSSIMFNFKNHNPVSFIWLATIFLYRDEKSRQWMPHFSIVKLNYQQENMKNIFAG